MESSKRSCEFATTGDLQHPTTTFPKITADSKWVPKILIQSGFGFGTNGGNSNDIELLLPQLDVNFSALPILDLQIVVFSCTIPYIHAYRMFSTVVEYVELPRNGSKNSWKVRTRRRDCVRRDVFVAVIVCDGHYSEPKLAEVTGISKWPGLQMHSHNYREPSSFIDQIECACEDGTVKFKSGGSVSADIILHCTG